jgi:hypothetical protein
LDTGGSDTNKVRTPQHNRAQGFHSWRTVSVELLSSAGEELGPRLAKDTFLSEPVNEKETDVLILWWVVKQGQMLSTEEATITTFSPPTSMLLLCTPRAEGVEVVSLPVPKSILTLASSDEYYHLPSLLLKAYQQSLTPGSTCATSSPCLIFKLLWTVKPWTGIHCMCDWLLLLHLPSPLRTAMLTHAPHPQNQSEPHTYDIES